MVYKYKKEAFIFGPTPVSGSLSYQVELRAYRFHQHIV